MNINKTYVNIFNITNLILIAIYSFCSIIFFDTGTFLELCNQYASGLVPFFIVEVFLTLVFMHFYSEYKEAQERKPKPEINKEEKKSKKSFSIFVR